MAFSNETNNAQANTHTYLYNYELFIRFQSTMERFRSGKKKWRNKMYGVRWNKSNSFAKPPTGLAEKANEQQNTYIYEKRRRRKEYVLINLLAYIIRFDIIIRDVVALVVVMALQWYFHHSTNDRAILSIGVRSQLYTIHSVLPAVAFNSNEHEKLLLIPWLQWIESTGFVVVFLHAVTNDAWQRHKALIRAFKSI